MNFDCKKVLGPALDSKLFARALTSMIGPNDEVLCWSLYRWVFYDGGSGVAQL